jgi:glutathione synthase/RimK-type ligase-like ATP-grasp enzyme
MRNLFVVETMDDWNISLPGVEVVLAKDYLTEEKFFNLESIRTYNLCKSYKYQSIGYYVSLLAEARGHKPVPSVATIQDLKSKSILKIASENLDELIQKSLEKIRSDEFRLSIYFGRNMANRYEKLCRELEKIYHAPLLQAYFVKNGKWTLKRIVPIGLRDVPNNHLPFIVGSADEYFGKRYATVSLRKSRFSLAILANPEEEFAPSNERALKKFEASANKFQISTELVTKNDYSRIGEFDGLFIRETTHVNHHTYRFAQKAHALDLVTIDDPISILRCTNKVYLHEILQAHGIPAPKTTLLHRGNLHTLEHRLEYPCILKQPDSSFSQGVVKADNADEFIERASELLENSELVIAQEFIPTDFDWRVGVIGGRALWVCRYFMAKKHWQIYKRSGTGKVASGNCETLSVDDAPPELIKLALRTAKLIGDGLYGLDIKQIGKKFYVIEVNDNPNIDAGAEDLVAKDQIYDFIMGHFLEKMLAKTERRP